jgi:hypothetical protein
MTSTNDPDQIRAEIERTQSDLSRDVDAFADKVSPGRIVERRVDRVRDTATRWKESVMGSGDHPHGGGRPEGTATRLAGSVQDAASATSSTVAGAVHDAPQTARRRTQGNPLAAGLIAFGTGLLVSSLLPAGRTEQQLADRAREQARDLGQPVADAARHAATEMRDNLAQPAREAADAVRSTAADAGHAVADDGRAAAQDVRGQAAGTADTVRRGPAG